MCGCLQHVLTGCMGSIEDARAIGRMLSRNTTLLALDLDRGKFPSKPDMCNYVGWFGVFLPKVLHHPRFCCSWAGHMLHKSWKFKS
jgi:hypothetical protein